MPTIFSGEFGDIFFPGNLVIFFLEFPTTIFFSLDFRPQIFFIMKVLQKTFYRRTAISAIKDFLRVTYRQQCFFSTFAHRGIRNVPHPDFTGISY